MKDPSKCGRCPIRRYAEKKPRSIVARIWNWHKSWCPGWKAYQRSLEPQSGKSPITSQNGQTR